MRRFLAALATLPLLYAHAASAAHLVLHEEKKEERRLNGVVFPITNNTGRNIDRIFGWVYGYGDAKPYRFVEVSNPNRPAERISPGPHRPGEKALYWFRLHPGMDGMDNYGLVVFDSSIWFER